MGFKADCKDLKLRLLYHGFISPDRSSMELLDLARALDSRRFSLSLMVLSNQKGFLEEFAREAEGIESLRLLPPVSLESIIPASAGYDIGLIPFKPTSFNLMHCMPNKLFEYIQARLCVVSTPLDSMQGFLARYEVGRLARDFSTAALVEAIHALSYEDVAGYKRASHRYAYELSLESNAPRIRRIIEGLLAP